MIHPLWLFAALIASGVACFFLAPGFMVRSGAYLGIAASCLLGSYLLFWFRSLQPHEDARPVRKEAVSEHGESAGRASGPVPKKAKQSAWTRGQALFVVLFRDQVMTGAIVLCVGLFAAVQLGLSGLSPTWGGENVDYAGWAFADLLARRDLACDALERASLAWTLSVASLFGLVALIIPVIAARGFGERRLSFGGRTVFAIKTTVLCLVPALLVLLGCVVATDRYETRIAKIDATIVTRYGAGGFLSEEDHRLFLARQKHCGRALR